MRPQIDGSVSSRRRQRPTEEDAMIEAHFTAGSKARPATLQTCITVKGRREWSAFEHVVAGKREARALAKTLNATPWNF